LSGRGLCDELITRPEESYRLCCVVVCDLETSRMGAPYIYDISHLRVNPPMLEVAVSYRYSKSHCIETNKQNTVLMNCNECAFFKGWILKLSSVPPFSSLNRKEPKLLYRQLAWVHAVICMLRLYFWFSFHAVEGGTYGCRLLDFFHYGFKKSRLCRPFK